MPLIQSEYFNNGREIVCANTLSLKRHIITYRNLQVSKKLQSIYGNQASGAMLPVFCVSKVMYWAHRQKPAEESGPYLELSGILGLRRYCIGIVAESHMRAAVSYIKDEIPAFLGSVELWIQAGLGDRSSEGKQQIIDTISMVQQELDEVRAPFFLGN